MCNDICIMPPCPELHDLIDKTKSALQAGSNLNNIDQVDLLDMRTFTLITGRPKKTRSQNYSLETSPVLGTRKALVLLVDFSDFNSTQSQNHFNDLFFSLGNNSLRDYYREVSYSQLNVTGEVSGHGQTSGWYRVPKAKNYYTNNNYGFGTYPKNAQKLVEDVIALAAPHVNFSHYDNTGDGKVESLVVICAGIGAEQSGNKSDIWSHKWSITPTVLDGVTIERYFMAPENGNVGVMCHELGHLLMGWPDLYDTDYSSRGTGNWDLMAGGSWNNDGNTPAHPTAWCKVKAGWITPSVIFNNAQNITIKPYASNKDVYKLPINSANSKEYFLLSNRKKQGFDAHLPGEGLIVEHIDDTKINNSDEHHYLVDIEQCDGLRELNKNINSGNANDAFPCTSMNDFTKVTTPNSKSYAGIDSEISVTDIAQSGANITAAINVGGVAAQEWKNDIVIQRTFTSYHSKNCWGYLQGIGWRKANTLSEDGVSNVFTTLTHAMLSNKKVSLLIDNNIIHQIYMN